MRFVVKQYEDGNMLAIETTDDGSAIVRSLTGCRQVAKRLSAFVEILGDDTPDGVARLKAALDYLTQVVHQRGAELAPKKRPARKKRRDRN
jgi:hypothetical protein